MDPDQIISIIQENIETAKKGKYRKRDLFGKAKKLMFLKQITSIVGVRRCGKSTLMKELVRVALKYTSQKNLLYLNLEHPFFNQFKEDINNLQLIYDVFKKQIEPRKKIFVFLDEIQFFKDWQVFVKHLYEKNEAKIVLTGSNSSLLSSELATLLSGRTIPLYVFPFSIHESKTSFKHYLTEGGFPEVVLSDVPKGLLAETYYKNILYQDVIPRFGIKNSMAIENLSFYLLSNIGKELSYNPLKSFSNLDDKTVKQYMYYLQDANLIYILNNYDFSLKKMIGNKKKVYCVDPIFTRLSFKNTPDYGRLFENFVYMQLKRIGAEIYFHKNGGECDFILKKGLGITSAIQVCYELNKDNREREFKGLINALNTFNLTQGFIVTPTQKKEEVYSGKKIKIIDMAMFIKKFGMNSEKAIF